MASFSSTAFDTNAFGSTAFDFGITPPVPTLPNAAGRVYKGKYPYWKPRKPFELPEYGKPPTPVEYIARDEEEFMILTSTELD